MDIGINYLHSLLHRPERGWDPVAPEYAEQYARIAWERLDLKIVDQIEEWLGGLEGKSILDLGGGPGQYSITFAQRGGNVTWYDISRCYLHIAQRYAGAMNVQLTFAPLGYLEQSKKLTNYPFDLVFNRECWYYCRDDRAFAKTVYELVRPGGGGYVLCGNHKFRGESGKRPIGKALTQLLETKIRIRIGHPRPPKGRIAELLSKFPMDYMIADYSSASWDIIFFIKSVE